MLALSGISDSKQGNETSHRRDTPYRSCLALPQYLLPNYSFQFLSTRHQPFLLPSSRINLSWMTYRTLEKRDGLEASHTTITKSA